MMSLSALRWIRDSRAVATVLIALAGLPPVGAIELINDGWSSGASVGFQVGFVSGEIGASRFVPAGSCPCFVSQVTLLFGGAAAIRTITLHIWDDDGSSAAPGAELFSRDFQLTASNTDLQLIDLSGDGVFVNGAFRVGIEFTADALPSIARDDDGNIQPNSNFILASGLGWVESSLLGLTGDWIIRANVEEQGDLAGELKNDAWPPTLSAAFQGGFVAGEAAAVRLTPPGPCPCPLNGVSVLIGGASGTADVGLRIWDDSALTLDPGALIYSDELQLVSADAALNIINLSLEAIAVNGPFRLGVVMNNDGFPSVASDDDGIDASVNFIDEDTLGWIESASTGVSGDWIMRAVISDQNLQTAVLGHDNWDSLLLPAFQQGFVANEIAAVRLEPDITCPCLVTGARLMFGGAVGPVATTLRIWEDVGTAVPGVEVYSAGLMLEGNDLALRVIDLSAAPVLVNGPFRIGLEFSQAGVPSVARDHDGITPGKNFVFDNVDGWLDSTDLGIPGDWIIRASVIPDLVFAADFESP